MSPRLPQASGRQVERSLRRIDFLRVSQKGSHAKLRNSEGRTVIVPMHRELAPGTLRSILEQANVTPEELANLLR